MSFETVSVPDLSCPREAVLLLVTDALGLASGASVQRVLQEGVGLTGEHTIHNYRVAFTSRDQGASPRRLQDVRIDLLYPDMETSKVQRCLRGIKAVALVNGQHNINGSVFPGLVLNRGLGNRSEAITNPGHLRKVALMQHVPLAAILYKIDARGSGQVCHRDLLVHEAFSSQFGLAAFIKAGQSASRQ